MRGLAVAVVAITVTTSAIAARGHASEHKAAPQVVLWLGGDVHLGAGGHNVLAPLPRIVGDAIGIVNLEGPIGLAGESRAGPRTRGTAGSGLRLLNSPTSAGELAAAGVRVAGIANNHGLDAGGRGDTTTARWLKGVGLAPAGLSAGNAMVELTGLRIVVAAYDLSSGLPPALALRLRAARRSGDVLVVSFHVTGPADYLPRPELRAAVDSALMAGAVVIAAHGTHVLGPVERRGPTVIAWGLGNLAFDCDCTDESEAIILRVAVGGEGAGRAEVIPIGAGLRGAAVALARDPDGILDLLEAIGSSPLKRGHEAASF